uniref:Uncharacterized protein n=1 Tax=Romanomermis culicivorax TaxID=13658 RepID=A0A915L4U6_ROMCU
MLENRICLGGGGVSKNLLVANQNVLDVRLSSHLTPTIVLSPHVTPDYWYVKCATDALKIDIFAYRMYENTYVHGFKIRLTNICRPIPLKLINRNDFKSCSFKIIKPPSFKLDALQS